MQNDAERAVARVGVRRMNVRDLHHRQQRQQNQADHGHHREITRTGGDPSLLCSVGSQGHPLLLKDT